MAELTVSGHLGAAATGTEATGGSAEMALMDLPWMQPLAVQLRRVGLEPTGDCQRLDGAQFDLLRQSPLLEDFTTSELCTLGGVMLKVRANAGQVMIAEGEISAWMMIVLSGTVDVTRKRTGSQEVTRLAVVRAGASVGEMSMLDGEPRYATCTAIEPVEAGVIGQMAIGQLIALHPAVAAKFMVKLTQIMAQRLRNTSNQLIKVVDERRAEDRAPR
jgi:CRP/FNR family cyclic AMP-dependent transcriptional regulator